MKTISKKLICVLCTIVLLLSFTACTQVAKNVFDEGFLDVSDTYEVTNTDVTFEEIFWAYFENEVAAKDSYYGNRYRITGYVDAIASDTLSGEIVVGLSKLTGRSMVAFDAVFQKDQKEQLKKIKVGDSLTFDGTCVDSQYWIKCVVVE